MVREHFWHVSEHFGVVWSIWPWDNLQGQGQGHGAHSRPNCCNNSYGPMVYYYRVMGLTLYSWHLILHMFTLTWYWRLIPTSRLWGPLGSYPAKKRSHWPITYRYRDMGHVRFARLEYTRLPWLTVYLALAWAWKRHVHLACCKLEHGQGLYVSQYELYLVGARRSAPARRVSKSCILSLVCCA